MEWREEILRRFGEVHNCMLCFWTPQHTRHDHLVAARCTRANARGNLHSHSTPVRACSCNRTHHHPLRPPVRRAAGTMTWRVLWSVAGGHECPPLIRFVEQGLLLCLLLCFCGVSPGWPGLGATGLGVCCRPCWGLRTLRACESANETGLYLPSSRLAYPPHEPGARGAHSHAERADARGPE